MKKANLFIGLCVASSIAILAYSRTNTEMSEPSEVVFNSTTRTTHGDTMHQQGGDMTTASTMSTRNTNNTNTTSSTANTRSTNNPNNTGTTSSTSKKGKSGTTSSTNERS